MHLRILGKSITPISNSTKKCIPSVKGPFSYQNQTYAAMSAVCLVWYDTAGFLKHTVIVIKEDIPCIYAWWNLYQSFPYALSSHKDHYLMVNKKYKKMHNNIRHIVLQTIILPHQLLRILGPDPHPWNDHFWGQKTFHKQHGIFGT